MPHIDTRSVVVEQTNENIPPEVNSPLSSLSVEHVDIITQPTTFRDVYSPPYLAQDEQTLDDLTLSTTPFEGETAPIPVQQMAFLKYLVSCGLVNEGFEEGCVPEQYRPKN